MSKEVSDPAFVLEPQEAALTGKEQRFLAGPCIGVNFSPLLQRYWNRQISLLDSLTECIERLLITQDMPIFLIPHVVYSESDDHQMLEKMSARVNQADRLMVLGKQYNCQRSSG